LRANEMGVDVILKATKVDGIYDSDPKKNPDATPSNESTPTDNIYALLQMRRTPSPLPRWERTEFLESPFVL